MTRYLTVQETKPIIVTALKEAFPAVRFTLRAKSYSGGASITVTWTDGPDIPAVEAVTKRFEAARFDGMRDYKEHRVHTMNGKEVSYGADFITSNRQYTEEFLRRVLRGAVAPGTYLHDLGVREEHFTIKEGYDGRPSLNATDPAALKYHDTLPSRDAYATIMQEAGQTAETFYLDHSPTAQAVTVSRVH